MKKEPLPEGWTEEKVEEILRHYESQTDEEAMAEDEAAWRSPDESFIQVPNELLPAVRALIAHYEAIKAEALRAS
jgi:hypothetical protein